MAEIQDPGYLANGCVTAQGDRQGYSSLVCTEGVAFGASSGGDLEVTQRGAGANMSVDVASGNAFVQGTVVGWQGMYHCSNDATENVTLVASDPTNDRIDLIVAQVRDSQYAGVVDDWLLTAVSGTPAPSPVAPSVPDNALVLAQVLVQNGVTTIVDADITDTRVPYHLCADSGVPQILVGADGGSFVKALFPGLKGVFVQVQAAGGGGGGARNAPPGVGGGGGGGAYCEAWFEESALPASVALAIGNGGTGGVGSGNGTAGGGTSFGTLIEAVGGSGGTESNGVGGGGAGGGFTASPGGALAVPGQAGRDGWNISTTGSSGEGGSAHQGHGAAGEVVISGATGGNNATGFGSGGSGAVNNGGTAQNGGDGADGLMLLWLYF